LAEEAYAERRVHLAAGDRMYLYSDGLPDAMNAGGERFGEARLLEAIERCRAEPLRVGLASLLGEIARWQGAKRPQDDSSILAVELAAVPKPDGPNRLRPQAASTAAETARLVARASTGS
jgi:serine phosphatase RsbU (regulator of sigma subunit)